MLRPIVKLEQQIDLGGGLWLLPESFRSKAVPFRAPVRENCVFDLRYADLTYLVRPGFVTDVIKLLGLDRIGKLFNLQFITPYRVTGEVRPVAQAIHRFHHDRLVHSLNSAVLHAAMLNQEGINGTRLKVSVLAELVHDAMSCAGGDAMKMIDPEYFDEDRLIARFFSSRRAGWAELKRRYGLTDRTINEVHQVVNGEGWQGQVHDITDTCSYLALDSQELAASYAGKSRELMSGELDNILALAEAGPCRIWRHVCLQDGHAVVQDVKTLYRFLELRARLYAGMYEKTDHKAVELLHTEVVFPYLFQRMAIHREELLKLDDHIFHQYVESVMEVPKLTTRIDLFGVWPRVEAYRSWEEANARFRELAADGDFAVISDVRLFQPRKPKTDRYWVGTKNGPRSFKQAFPKEAASVEKIFAEYLGVKRPVHLFVHPGVAKRLPRPMTMAWGQARERWQGQRG